MGPPTKRMEKEGIRQNLHPILPTPRASLPLFPSELIDLSPSLGQKREIPVERGQFEERSSSSLLEHSVHTHFCFTRENFADKLKGFLRLGIDKLNVWGVMKIAFRTVGFTPRPKKTFHECPISPTLPSPPKLMGS